MTIDLKPEDEQWLQEIRDAIGEQIEAGFAQLGRGEGLTPEESLAQLETLKATWRANQQRA